MEKTRYQKRKIAKLKAKRKQFFKKYFFAICTFIGAIFPFGYSYYEKAHDTKFIETYFALELTNDLHTKLTQNNYSKYYQDMLKFPTLNNVLNQKLLAYADQGYYVIYLILSQVGNEEAINTKLKLKDSLSTKVTELSVDFKLLKNQGFKIPLAICKLEDLAKTTFNFQDCLDPYYEVQEISYRNNHFFLIK